MADLEPQTKSIQSIYNWYSNNKLIVNRRYQRKLVWTLEEKQRLIESVQKKYPIPAVLLVENQEGNYEIIDGLQRLFTILSFIENEFCSVSGKKFNLKAFPTALERYKNGEITSLEGAEEITPSEAADYLDYNLSISIMRNSTEAEIGDVFQRINTYGHQLSDQERRQSGVQDLFAETVRKISESLRGGDAEEIILPLNKMHEISIDLPKTNHGYKIKASDVFWVREGILNGTDLRDSLDEQCIADILACIINPKLITRSKDSLDKIYTNGTTESVASNAALKTYGPDKIREEILHCINEIQKVVHENEDQEGFRRLKDLIYEKPSKNAFPTTFATLVIAFYESLIKGSKHIVNYSDLKKSLNNINNSLVTTKKSGSVALRRKNINTVKGQMEEHLSDGLPDGVYENKTFIDIDRIISASLIEHARFELKQGALPLNPANRDFSDSLVSKVLSSCCAIANSGRGHGTLIVGVADKMEDVKKIEKIDGINPREVNGRYVVGVNREAKALGIAKEEYFKKWVDKINKSELSQPLKADILGNLEWSNYYGLGLIIFNIPPQKEISTFEDKFYHRVADNTLQANAKDIIEIAKRF